VKEKNNIKFRVMAIYIGFVLVMLLVLFKTVTIQMEGRTGMLSDSEDKIPTRVIKRAPRRGEILDINFTPLVTSIAYYDIHMDPTVVKEEIFNDQISDLAKGLAKMYTIRSAREWENYIRTGRKRGNRYLKIKNKASNDERRMLAQLPIYNLGRMKGGLIDNDVTIIRKKPYNELLRRTLGYVSTDGRVLKVGLEGAYDSYLAGEFGEEIEQKISTGWKKTGQIIKEAVEGADIVTSIDIEIQEVAHSELLKQLQTHKAKHGCVVVMDVKTGFVKAIVNLALGSDGNYYESYNLAIGPKEVPGSTFKLASLMAGLEDQKFSIYDKVQTAPKYTFYKSTLNEAHGQDHGKISIKHAFELSSNVISKVINEAYKGDEQAFVNRIKSFGLGDKLGLDLSGEATPTLYEPGTKNWSGISLPWLSVGYETQQTPLQTLTFYNAVANNGKLVRPQFVKQIKRGAEVVKDFKPYVLNPQICSNKTLRDLKICIEGVMKNGTGRRLNSSYFEIAGKTGTAEILNDDMRYGNKGEKKYLASFVGYFPVEDPIYSCIVSIAASGENIYGASVSGTVFSAIANKVYATSLQYHDAVNENAKKIKEAPISKNGSLYDLVMVLNKLNVPYSKHTDSEWVSTVASGQKVELKKKEIKKGVVPNVIGMTAKDAIYIIESVGMRAEIKGYGVVYKQSYSPGAPAFNGGVIELMLK
jgi:cell division protein FtsI (penicillin-binding protein 3)